MAGRVICRLMMPGDLDFDWGDITRAEFSLLSYLNVFAA